MADGAHRRHPVMVDKEATVMAQGTVEMTDRVRLARWSRCLRESAVMRREAFAALKPAAFMPQWAVDGRYATYHLGSMKSMADEYVWPNERERGIPSW